MKYLNKPVMYLQKSDFNDDGSLKNPELQNGLCIIMIQANFCGYCTQAKPDYQKFADNNKQLMCATIQADGDQPGEKELGKMVKKIDPSFRGYPGYVAYKNGKMVKVHNGGRNTSDLQQFANSV
jgi:thiol-disulfide isomerase/thioredoxin